MLVFAAREMACKAAALNLYTVRQHYKGRADDNELTAKCRCGVCDFTLPGAEVGGGHAEQPGTTNPKFKTKFPHFPVDI